MRPLSEMSTIQSGGIIYLAVCRETRQSYIGQTTHTPEHRMSSHSQRGKHSPSASYFQRALNKYGHEAFDFAVLQRCGSKPEMNEAERRWIALIGSCAPAGYNIAAGGEGSLIGRRSVKWQMAVRSAELRDKQSARVRLLRSSLTEEQKQSWRDNAAAARRGVSSGKFGDSNVSRRPEVREKIRLSKLGKKRNDMIGNTFAKKGIHNEINS